MKERPIIFSTDMVKAILDGRKTMTRRIKGLDKFNEKPDIWKIGKVMVNDTTLFWSASCDWSFSYRVDCPYGQVGDRLWVRETWGLAIKAGSSIRSERLPHYKADGEILPRWTPSIFMPRWASRLTLEITGVRVERLQEISREDARAEGCTEIQCNCGECIDSTEIGTFQNLWNSINYKRGYGWEKNPWCWCISFKQVSPSGL